MTDLNAAPFDCTFPFPVIYGATNSILDVELDSIFKQAPAVTEQGALQQNDLIIEHGICDAETCYRADFPCFNISGTGMLNSEAIYNVPNYKLSLEHVSKPSAPTNAAYAAQAAAPHIFSNEQHVMLESRVSREMIQQKAEFAAILAELQEQVSADIGALYLQVAYETRLKNDALRENAALRYIVAEQRLRITQLMNSVRPTIRRQADSTLLASKTMKTNEELKRLNADLRLQQYYIAAELDELRRQFESIVYY